MERLNFVEVSLEFHGDFLDEEPASVIVKFLGIVGFSKQTCVDVIGAGGAAHLITLDLGHDVAALNLDAENMFVQVDFLTAVVGDHWQGLLVEGLHDFCCRFRIQVVRSEAVNHGLGHVLAQLTL